MDGILVVLILAVLAIPVLIIVLLVGQSRLRARVTQLEQRLGAITGARPEMASQAMAAPSLAEMLPKLPELPKRQDYSQPEMQGLQAVGDASQPLDKAGRPDTPKQPEPVEAPDKPDGPVVMRPARFAALAQWLVKNWVYAVSALSLALAGVFFVQYGMERGLLPPGLRVLAAIGLGLALIGGGEWIRRRHGDEGEAASANLPSVFSGAGLVAIFAGIIAARQLYGLVGPETAFGGLLATALAAVVLGWLHGPLLAAIGLLGAAATPFLVAGGSQPGPLLYGYYAMISAIGLAVDAIRRWAWISVLALALGFGGIGLMYLGQAGLSGAAVSLVLLAVLSVGLPVLQLVPTHAGPSLTETLIHRKSLRWPNFPVRLAFGATLASSAGLLGLWAGSAGGGMLVLAALAVLAIWLTLWADRAEGLSDLALLPALAFVLRLVTEVVNVAPLPREFKAMAILLRAPETAAPATVSIILAMAVAISAVFAWRSLREKGIAGYQLALAAVLTASMAVAALEFFWVPSPVLGAFPWALHVIGLAAVMVALALRYARQDHPALRRAALATLSALSLIALSLFLLTSQSPLTLALTVLVVAAAALDRRFNLPEMAWFVQAGVAVLGFRLFADPGLSWAMSAPLYMMLMTYLGVILGLLAAIVLLRPRARIVASGVLESAAAGVSAVLVNILLARWMAAGGNAARLPMHAYVTLSSLPWLVLMVMQIYRMKLGGPLRHLRAAIAVAAGLGAASGIASAVTLFNPLFTYSEFEQSGVVRGPWLLDSMFLAYLMPGLILIAAALKLPSCPRLLRRSFLGPGLALVALYAALEIRRFWQGDWLGAPGVLQGELYSYTLALMVLGAVLLYQAIARRSALLRRAAMAVIALVVAKVFLWDASGLTGLTRVVSFLGLGLSLAGLAWLNRWAGQISGGDAKPAPSPGPEGEG